MKYQAQMQVTTLGGTVRPWENVGDPMTSEEADSFLSFTARVPYNRNVKIQVIVIPLDYPSVFLRKQAE